MSLQPFYNDASDIFEIGLDEAGRGPLFGRLYVAAVVLPKDGSFVNKDIKDSKKIKSVRKMKACVEYIKQNAMAYSIQYIEHTVIDDINIRQSVFRGMHNCIDDILKRLQNKSDTNANANTNVNKHFILVDGNDFKPYVTYNDKTGELIQIPFQTIEGGDNKYVSIAAASILAKEARDSYISELCIQYPAVVTRYGINKNMGYGTKQHLSGILEHGITQFHRKTYARCKEAECMPL